MTDNPYLDPDEYRKYLDGLAVLDPVAEHALRHGNWTEPEPPTLDRDAIREALAKVDPDMHRRLVNGDWTIEQCKHCGLAIGGAPGRVGWLHLEGKQRLMHRCALDPYGYDATPVGTMCSIHCHGYVDDPDYRGPGPAQHSDPHYQAATERWERNQ